MRLGIWEKINQTLVRKVRKAKGREEEPSLIIIDSQSVNVLNLFYSRSRGTSEPLAIVNSHLQTYS